MSEQEGYQGFVVPAPPIVIPPPGGLLSTVSNFTSTFGVNQDFVGAVQILFQQEAVLPGGSASEITVVGDNNFEPTIVPAVYRIAWQFTVLEFGGVAPCTVRSLLRLNSGAEFPGTGRTMFLPIGGAGVMAGEIWIPFVAGDDYEFLISRTAGAGTPRLLAEEIAHSVARMTTPP